MPHHSEREPAFRLAILVPSVCKSRLRTDRVRVPAIQACENWTLTDCPGLRRGFPVRYRKFPAPPARRDAWICWVSQVVRPILVDRRFPSQCGVFPVISPVRREMMDGLIGGF